MEFFQKLNPLMDGVEKLTITIMKKEGKLTVMFLPDTKNNEVNEKLKPVSMVGTAEEVDAGFIAAVQKVNEAAASAVFQLEGYDKELKELTEKKKKQLEDKKNEPAKPAAKKSDFAKKLGEAERRSAKAKKAAAAKKKGESAAPAVEEKETVAQSEPAGLGLVIMFALQVTDLKRKFVLKKNGKEIELDDPNADLTPEEVMKFYAGTHSELTNATITGPKVEGGKATYSFKTVVGTKG